MFKTKTKKSKGRYVSEDPDYDCDRESPRGKLKQVIRKGGRCKEEDVFGDCHKFIRTCPFDAVTELMRGGIRISGKFRKYLEKIASSDNGLINSNLKEKFNYAKVVVESVDKTLAKAKFYLKRAYILYALFIDQQKNHTINCEYNANAMLKHVMAGYENSVETTHCSVCDLRERQVILTIPLPNVLEIWQNGLKYLETMINKYFEDKLYSCNHCHLILERLGLERNNNLTQTKTMSTGNFLCIESDLLYYYRQAATDNDNDICKFKSNLRDLPTTLRIKNEAFVLCGVVERIPPFDSSGVAHYVTYSRSLNDMWTLLDGCNGADRKTYNRSCPDVEMHLIFYVKH